MKVTATIQARMSSSRLPGKVLKPILGKPMLSLQIERIQKCKLVDEVIIASTENPNDDPIESLAKELEVPCFRGSEDDVLGRIVNALKKYKVDIHVELTGDHPLEDPEILDSAIDFYLKNSDKYDYVTNCLKTTYPPGIGFSIYPAKILIDAEKHVDKNDKLREHVSIHINQHPERYRIYNIKAPPNFNYPDMYIEVDTKEDFNVVTSIYEALYPKNPNFNLSQIIEFMSQNKDLSELNQNIPRRWKQFRED